jgi:hypothetical protein
VTFNQYLIGQYPVGTDLKEAHLPKDGWAIGAELTVSTMVGPWGEIYGHSDMSFGEFDFWLDPAAKSKGLALDVGISLKGVFAYGGPPENWAGQFNVFEVNVGIWSIAAFASPDGSWQGVAWGIGLSPTPISGGWQHTDYAECCPVCHQLHLPGECPGPPPGARRQK